MKSCLYVGRVRHRRFVPVNHFFNYRLFMVYLDLAELPDLFDPYWLWSSRSQSWAWFRRADHLGDPDQPLSDAVRELVKEKTGRQLQGPIRLLTHLRYLGYCFNPVSFYYCFDRSDQRLETIVAEVTNTPWGEQHCYVLECPDQATNHQILRLQFEKAFHVSPFMPMEVTYDWRFNIPAKQLVIHMNNFQGTLKQFDATLCMEQRAITHRSLARMLISYPAMGVKIIGGIYLQAFRLWLKRCPFFVHPAKKAIAR